MHSVATSAASVADKHMLPDLLHGEERKVWGDGGYQGQAEAIRKAAPKAQDMTCRRTRYKNYFDEEAKHKNTTKARVRAKVEHPFHLPKTPSKTAFKSRIRPLLRADGVLARHSSADQCESSFRAG